MVVQGKHHRGHKHGETKGKWRNKVQKISELLSVMDKMQVPGGLPFVSAHDISACEDLLEAYFMQARPSCLFGVKGCVSGIEFYNPCHTVALQRELI